MIVITRHPALVTYLRETGMIGDDAVILRHATPEDVAGQHVIGVLPLRLAALAASLTEVPLDIPAELRGQELTVEQVRQYAGEPVRYFIRTEQAIMAEYVEIARQCDRATGDMSVGDAVMSMGRRACEAA